MPKTVQIREIDDEVYTALKRHAATEGLSVPEFLRREISRLAARPTMTEWLERTRRRSSPLTTADVLETLDAVRGARPDARR